MNEYNIDGLSLNSFLCRTLTIGGLLVLLSFGAVSTSVKPPFRSLPQSVMHRGNVRYFAFGSNLLREKMDSRGDTEVVDCIVGAVADQRLAFNMRMFPPLEPSMASIEPCPGAVCEGALYTLTRATLFHIRSGAHAPLLPVEK